MTPQCLKPKVCFDSKLCSITLFIPSFIDFYLVFIKEAYNDVARYKSHPIIKSMVGIIKQICSFTVNLLNSLVDK
jgi:hypothetical protein